MKRDNVTYSNRMPLGLWDKTPAGIRAALISLPIIFAIYLLNSFGLSIFHGSKVFNSISTALLLCYPVQLLGYVLNGWIAGAQAQSTHSKATRVTGRSNERVRNKLADHVGAAVLAGVLLAFFLVLVYFIAGASVKSFLPGLELVANIATLFYLVVDAGLCIGCSILGGMIYRRWG